MPQFFCHACQQETAPIRDPDIRCASCNGSFVEELPPDSDSDPSHDPRRWAAQDPDEETAGSGGHEPPADGNPMGQFMHILGFASQVGNNDGWDVPNSTASAQDSPQRPTDRETSTSNTPSSEPSPAFGMTNPSSFMRLLFGRLGTDSSSQPVVQSGGGPRLGESAPQASNRSDQRGTTRTFSRTFNNGQGQLSFVVGTGSGLFEHTPSNNDNDSGDTVHVRALQSFLQEAFAMPPQTAESQSQASGTPSGEGAQPQDGPDGPHLFTYLNSILNRVGVRAGFFTGPTVPPGVFGNYVWSDEAMTALMSQLMAQASGNSGPPPATEETISRLPRVAISKEMLSAPSITDCAICKDELEENDECIVLSCNHIFHSEDCLIPWLKRNGTCPVCRSPVAHLNNAGDPDESVPSTSQSPRPATSRRGTQGMRVTITRSSSSTAYSPALEGSSLPENWFALAQTPSSPIEELGEEQRAVNPSPQLETTSPVTYSGSENQQATHESHQPMSTPSVTSSSESARDAAAAAAVRRSLLNQDSTKSASTDHDETQPMDLD